MKYRHVSFSKSPTRTGLGQYFSLDTLDKHSRYFELLLEIGEGTLEIDIHPFKMCQKLNNFTNRRQAE